MANITDVTDHREREKGNIVYPVYSRRSGGLSIGINLFTDKKSCAFDCPYCEVFPFSGVNTDGGVFFEQLENDLRSAIAYAREQGIPIRDICFSGNGEPTLSPHFPEALKSADNIRREAAPSAELVVITNGTGLLQPRVFSLLKDAAVSSSFNIWLKLDAGTQAWYRKINRSSVQFDKLIEKITEFASCAPVTIQTMICSINGEAPSPCEAQAWEALVCKLARGEVSRAMPENVIRKVQLYGKARPAPEDPFASPLPEEYLETRSESLKRAFRENGITIPVDVYL